jgi:hypothetical protein
VPFYPGMPLTVAVADPPRALVLWLVTTANKAIDPTRPWPDEHVAWSWAFILEPLDANTTRLLTRMRVTYQPTVRWGPYVHLLLEPGHFVMGRQLLGLRQRTQATGRPARSGGNRVLRAREVARSAADVVVACPRFVTAPLYRRWHLRWGATDAEVISVMPGDELVPHPSFTATRAITISAAPKDVWPWIVQIGTGRAGFYSYDLFDNAARPSAERILPQLQEIRVGDWMPMSTKVNETTAFKVKAFEPTQWLLWAKPHSTWSWRLTPTEDGGTRLVTRLKEKYNWRSPGLALLTIILFEFGDFPMMRRLLLRMKSRAEGPPPHSQTTSAGVQSGRRPLLPPDRPPRRGVAEPLPRASCLARVSARVERPPLPDRGLRRAPAYPGQEQRPHRLTSWRVVPAGAEVQVHPVWHLPNDPNTRTTRQLVDTIYRLVGQPKTMLRSTPTLLLQALR